MTKIVECPVPEFAGKVHFVEPLKWPQLLAWRRAFNLAVTKQDPWEALEVQLPGILAIVEKFENPVLAEVRVKEDFPGSPEGAVYELVAWLISEITKIVNGVEEAPNG